MKHCFLLLTMLMLSLCAEAQRVTISPTSGRVVTVVKDNEASASGFGGMWIHNQLPLTLVVDDYNKLDQESENSVTHANNISETFNPDGGLTLISLGHGYMVLSLPKGYRFTAYKMTVSANLTKSKMARAGLLPSLSSSGSENGWCSGDMEMTETMAGQTSDAYISDLTTAGSVVVGPMPTKEGDYKSVTLSRTSMTSSDMGNKLYFRYGVGETILCALSITSLEVSFVADVPITVDMTPVTSTLRGFDCMKAEFNTGRLDLGAISLQTKTTYDGQTRSVYAYNTADVENLQAGMFLYDTQGINSETNQPDPTVFTDRKIKSHMLDADGTGTFQNEYAYIFKPGTYYIESPVHAFAKGADEYETEIPIGYRITGIKVNCTYRKHWERADGFYITGWNQSDKWEEQTPTTIYYLKLNKQKTGLTWTENKNQAAVWHLDEEESGDSKSSARICCVDGDATYYIKVLNLNNRTMPSATITSSQDEGSYMRKRSDGTISLGTEAGNSTLYLQFSRSASSSSSNSSIYFTTSKTDAAIASNLTTHSKYTTETEPTAYTVKLYGIDGSDNATEAKSVTVNKYSGDTSISLDKLNNDAIRFDVMTPEGENADNTLAQLTFEVTLEPLDPYIQKLDVKCASEGDGDNTGATLTQQFVTTDFRIGADDMTFYVPTNFATNQTLTFSFENLYNSHHDGTYFTDFTTEDLKGDGESRYSVVGSAYYTGVSKEDPHNSSYDSNNNSYKDKVTTSIVGDKQFMFNNSKKLAAEVSSTLTTDYFQEYLFSSTGQGASGSTYKAVDDSGNETTGRLGALTVTTAEVGKEGNDGTEKTFYLFTVDEPRYVISPATGMRHQYYAFYNGSMKVKATEYEAHTEYELIYEKSLTRGTDGNPVDGKYYGVKLQAKSGDEVLASGTGYLTARQIMDKISKDMGDGTITTKPADMKHILYVDATNLNNVLHDVVSGTESTDNTTNTETGLGKLETLRTMCAANALIYLPNLTTTYRDNCARKMLGGNFIACNNITLTDQEPFYAPYAISLNANKHVRYDRKVTSTPAGSSMFVTVMLPFSMSVSNGVHTADGGKNLYFYTPKNNFLVTTGVDAGEEGKDYNAGANFTTYSGFAETKANVPYLVKLYKGTDDSDTEVFSIVQNGSLIAATTDHYMKDTLEYTDGAVTSTINGSSWTFTPCASYSGAWLPKAGYYFYFGTSKFYLSNNLADRYDYAYNLPFRGFFASKCNGTSGAKTLPSSLNLVFDIDDVPTGINVADGTATQSDILIATSNGTISVKALTDTPVGIVNVAGQSVARQYLNAGESIDVAVSQGLYIVNGVKVTVR